jgi:hypothetical protein
MKSVILTTGCLFLFAHFIHAERIIIHVVDDLGNNLSNVELKFIQAKQEGSTDDWGLSDKNINCGKYDNLDILVLKKEYRVISPDTTNALTIHRSNFNQIFRIVMKKVNSNPKPTLISKGLEPATYDYPKIENSSLEIQIKASSVEISKAVLLGYAKLLGLSVFMHYQPEKPYPYKYRLHLDTNSTEAASQTLNQVKNLGFNDAFIVH